MRDNTRSSINSFSALKFRKKQLLTAINNLQRSEECVRCSGHEVVISKPVKYDVSSRTAASQDGAKQVINGYFT